MLFLQACDSTFNSSDDTLSECKSQKIDNRLTSYSWEIATEEGAEFWQPLQSGAVLDSFKCQQLLYPLFLRPGLYVRCTAQAVDNNGVRGYSRTSLPVQLKLQQNNSCYKESSGAGLQAKLSSYQSFMAEEKVCGD